MANRGYQRSAARERQLVNEARAKGIVAYRTPQSKGAADVLLLSEGDIELVQVKTGGKSPFSGFPPAERAKLLDEAERAGGVATYVWFPGDGKGRRIYPAGSWPSV
jgi:Holliday junction resolvase